MAACLAALAGCSLDERSDFLVGRSCQIETSGTCDEGQVCLPHQWRNEPSDFRCRDRESFNPDPSSGEQPPLAYCDGAKYVCPGDLVCNADRIRVDGGYRRLVCQPPDSPFAPPSRSDGGVTSPG